MISSEENSGSSRLCAKACVWSCSSRSLVARRDLHTPTMIFGELVSQVYGMQIYFSTTTVGLWYQICTYFSLLKNKKPHEFKLGPIPNQRDSMSCGSMCYSRLVHSSDQARTYPRALAQLGSATNAHPALRPRCSIKCVRQHCFRVLHCVHYT